MSLDDIKEGLDDAEQKAEWLRKRIEVTGPEYDEDRDGQLFPVVLTTPAQAFYNRAIFPGWQKWNPIFRHGTITAITDGLADITLESVQSSAQNLEINQESTISGVPFEYMNCDHLAFKVGDVVLIMFSDQMFTDPKVIGFKEEPRACGPYPSMVVYDSPGGDQVGVVVCTGGGFEPPYVFIPRTDPLPADDEDTHLGELPDQRIWDGWRDIEPSGEYKVYSCFSNGRPYELDHSISFRGRHVRACQTGISVRTISVCGGGGSAIAKTYGGGVIFHHDATRNESYSDSKVFSFSPDGFQYWDSYDYEGGTFYPGRKPDRLISHDPQFNHTLQGSSNDRLDDTFGAYYTIKDNPVPIGSVMGVTFYCFDDYTGDYSGEYTAEIDADVTSSLPLPNYDYESRDDYYDSRIGFILRWYDLASELEFVSLFGGEVDYYFLEQIQDGFFLNSSVVSEDKYSVAYNVRTYEKSIDVDYFSPPGRPPPLSCDGGQIHDLSNSESETLVYGPVKTVMDGEVHEIDIGDREWAYACNKYFDLEERLDREGERVALFCLGDLDDESMQKRFIYARNNNGDIQFTETQIDITSPLQDVVDADGEDVDDDLYIHEYVFIYSKELRLIGHDDT